MTTKNTDIRDQIRSAKSDEEVRKLISGFVGDLLATRGGTTGEHTGRGRKPGKDWFKEAWQTFLSDKDEKVQTARESDMRGAFKNWLTKSRMKQHGWRDGEPIEDTYFNVLVSKRLKRVYTLKEEEQSEGEQANA